MNLLPNAPAMEEAKEVLPTPGGPTKHSTGPRASGLSCTSKNKLVPLIFPRGSLTLLENHSNPTLNLQLGITKDQPGSTLQ